jgi:hypothetical protein
MLFRRLPTTAHKRGDTFGRRVTITASGAPVDLTGATITCEVRTLSLTLVDTLIVDPVDLAGGVVDIASLDTSSWPLADLTNPLLCDLKRVDADTLRTQTFTIQVVQEITE